jgi:hypothetical protein
MPNYDPTSEYNR